MHKHQRLTVALCLLMSASIMFGQAAKSVFTYAPLTGWLLSAMFCILALFSAAKAYAKH